MWKSIISGTVFAASGLVVFDGHAADAEALYDDYCAACHNFGVAGAPKVGDRKAWVPRIAKGNLVLIDHAINGYDGDSGSMPPKGGFADLSDEEVRAIVHYMVSRAQ